MAIPCPGCGREYDVTLFQFGRTISCTCGTRVGPEKRIPSPYERGRWDVEGTSSGTGVSRRPRFLADAMLGRLARWLRALGYDTVFEPEIQDGVAVRRALEEDRILLTRDRNLHREWRIEAIVVLRSNHPDLQLQELREKVDVHLRRDRLFTRCLRCNTLLEPISPSEAAARVPPRIRKANHSFRRCPACDGTFWDGSHTSRMREKFQSLLGDPREDH